MKLIFKCQEACLYFDETRLTFVVVEKSDIEIIKNALIKDLQSDTLQDRLNASQLITMIQKYKWTNLF